MGIGGCIGLIAVGGILTFAVDWDLAGVNVDLVGIIMMVVGLIGLAVYASVLRRRRVQALHPGAAPVMEVDDPRYYR
ncbi:DUF6458 family protein [Streptomyces zingiberis]|uniref:DUF6458 domain-containing protein n=1 Tax=Streptomyces zingiberis TaxID=2053010 RepID=A0ABX1BNN9_9ACTN|nr:DUF6458 family protein [Streptomyces zingiberis]NJP99310.1 hypothetical protein [Streptomyces zingiberis]